jgi:hypothetical protein
VRLSYGRTWKTSPFPPARVVNVYIANYWKTIEVIVNNKKRKKDNQVIKKIKTKGQN